VVIAYTLRVLCSCILICYIPIYMRIYFLIHVLQLTVKKGHIYLQMDIKWQHKELFKIWIQKKGNHSNNKSEYVQNSDGYLQIRCL
jgi:hypothetical protein